MGWGQGWGLIPPSLLREAAQSHWVSKITSCTLRCRRSWATQTVAWRFWVKSETSDFLEKADSPLCKRFFWLNIAPFPFRPPLLLSKTFTSLWVQSCKTSTPLRVQPPRGEGDAPGETRGNTHVHPRLWSRPHCSLASTSAWAPIPAPRPACGSLNCFRWSAELQAFAHHGRPLPRFQVTLCFGEEFPDPQRQRKLITAHVSVWLPWGESGQGPT